MAASSLAALLLLWLPVKSAAGTCSTGESSMLQMGRQTWGGRRRPVTTEPPDLETPDNMPEYTVRISGKGGNLGFLEFKADTAWQEAMAGAGKYLLQQRLVEDAAIDTCSEQATEVCLEIKVQGAVVMDPTAATVPPKGGELEVTFSCEKHMDPWRDGILSFYFAWFPNV
ncbi:pol [Symbiodinium microadriaticum]|nr:pol [Symbiodinium microadriaticum]CAE7949101.1 pol [Symbiodinium sp. KB8]